MKAKDLREKTLDDLRELEKSLAKDTFQNRFKNFTNRLDDTSTINKTKRDLARVKTIIAELEKKSGSAGGRAKKAAPPKKASAAKTPAAAKKRVAMKARPKSSQEKKSAK